MANTDLARWQFRRVSAGDRQPASPAADDLAARLLCRVDRALHDAIGPRPGPVPLAAGKPDAVGAVLIRWAAVAAEDFYFREYPTQRGPDLI